MARAALTLKDERREAEREDVRLRARVFPDGAYCLIGDINRTGARLVFPDAATGVRPAVVVLWDTGQAFQVEAVWNRLNEVGVRFLRTCQLDDDVPAPFAAAKAAWARR